MYTLPALEIGQRSSVVEQAVHTRRVRGSTPLAAIDKAVMSERVLVGADLLRPTKRSERFLLCLPDGGPQGESSISP